MLLKTNIKSFLFTPEQFCIVLVTHIHDSPAVEKGKGKQARACCVERTGRSAGRAVSFLHSCAESDLEVSVFLKG